MVDKLEGGFTLRFVLHEKLWLLALASSIFR